MVGVHEHVGTHAVVVPYEAMFQVLADGVAVDVGKVGLAHKAVERPDPQVQSDDGGRRPYGMVVAVVGQIGRVGQLRRMEREAQDGLGL